MTWRPPLLSVLALAGFNEKRARVLAEMTSAEEHRRRQAESRADETRLRERMAQVERMSNILVGTTESGIDYRIPLNEYMALAALITGPTGIGKTSLVCGMFWHILFAILRGEEVSVIILDGKNDTANGTERTVAQVAQALPRQQRNQLLSNLYKFRFFDKEFLPSWPILARSDNTSLLAQGDVIAETLMENATDATVGPRQRLVLSRLCSLAIEFAIPIVQLPWLLNDPTAVVSLAKRSTIPILRLDLSRYDRESQSSLDGLVVRLNILLVPALKAVLSGPTPFDVRRLFDPGTISIMSSYGAERAQRSSESASGSLFFSDVVNAALDPDRQSKGITVLIIDEPSAFLNNESLAQALRLLRLGRSFGAGGIHFVTQSELQLPAELRASLATNAPLRILGRCSETDAQAAQQWLRLTGNVPRSKNPGMRRAGGGQYMTDAQEMRHRVIELGRLPRRHFLVAVRGDQFAPPVIRSADFSPPRLDEVDPEIAQAVRRGVNGIPRAELEAHVRELEEEADARFQETLRTEAPRGRRRSRVLDTPDVVGREPDHMKGKVP